MVEAAPEMRPWSCGSREPAAAEKCGSHAGLPPPVATRNWAAAAAEPATRGPPAIAVPLTLAPAPTAAIPAGPTSPRRRGAHHPGVPGATPAATSPQQPQRHVRLPRVRQGHHLRGRAGEGASCRFSKVARGRAGKRTPKLVR